MKIETIINLSNVGLINTPQNVANKQDEIFERLIVIQTQIEDYEQRIEDCDQQKQESIDNFNDKIFDLNEEQQNLEKR